MSKPSDNPADKDIQRLLSKAKAEISEALSIAKRSRDTPSRAVAKELERILSGLNAVGAIGAASGPAEQKKSQEEKIRLFREAQRLRWAKDRANKS